MTTTTTKPAATAQAASDAETFVTLGGEEYLLIPPPYNQARAWRKRFQEPLDRLLGAVGESRVVLQSLNLPNADDPKAMMQALKGMDVGQIVRIFAQVVPELVRAPDLAWDLLMAWSPTLSSQADAIGDVATDSEVMAAFVEVVKQAYPLGTLVAFLGPSKVGTPKNSPVPRGKPKNLTI